MNRALRLIVALLVPSVGSAQGGPRSPFHDDLLDRLIGRWNVVGTVHGAPSKQTLRAEWVLSHQFLRVYEKSVENVAGTNVPYEGVFYFGFDDIGKRYVVHLMNVFGGRDSEGLGYGQRSGDEVRLVFQNLDASIASRFIWQPGSSSWRIVSTAKGEGTPIIDLEATKAR